MNFLHMSIESSMILIHRKSKTSSVNSLRKLILKSPTNGEIAKINSRDAGYASEAQKILSMINNATTRLDNIEEACRNDFGNISSEFTSIRTSIEALRNEMIQCYAIAQRLQVELIS
ncbi:hypothetical protein GLOIN_2v1620909 [Rhizophagus irregularis DAOM 181602=DAOM 197198]|uniref:Uncharacterized protein n=2 Tax=Rhizophagus irregularis (strain DAOM 181602 / DAOM 197198 / MUCL 43194) TaxID=747089 RepID=A0A2P4PXI8_RHIID|nr:hypothetical protein GLOIN_2v1620909 [Rhizophagus irregularis DAOM 181602=DAOM 197198]POG70075.1 hypothetical protein GLOIN_2v1620909 [Rhizophagus irregularis DAOM 181602=DAOM 197198]|eukprot:XP_025176941.1 hypothetical protein GLOIN_2v1620909 [Rhizophagus irregularis DAOM 181602=DAOM 197198]